MIRMTIGRLVGWFPRLKTCCIVLGPLVLVVRLQMALAGRFMILLCVRVVMVVVILAGLGVRTV